MALSCIVSEIPNVKQWGALDICVRCHSRSLKLATIAINWLKIKCDFLLAFHRWCLSSNKRLIYELPDVCTTKLYIPKRQKTTVTIRLSSISPRCNDFSSNICIISPFLPTPDRFEVRSHRKGFS